MRVFREKADRLLHFLNDFGIAEWDELFMATGINENDPIVLQLQKGHGFIHISDNKIKITQTGIRFISATSFVEIREKKKVID